MTRHAECVANVTVLCLISAVLAWSAGSFGLSWDALNHHVYLGLIAESPRWHSDIAAAASQSYQYPYIYWPFYRLTQSGLSGNAAAVIWSVLQTLCIAPPVWLVSAHLLGSTRDDWEARVLRVIGCCLGFASILVLAAVTGSANDLLAAAPLLWAIALALVPTLTRAGLIVSGILAGMSLAFKFSNALCMPIYLLALVRPELRYENVRRLLAAGIMIIIGFVAAYSPWGWQLWQQFGNPFYPHFDAFFRG